MIQFNNSSQAIPYLLFFKKYNQAINQKQKNIDAISISSYNPGKKEVDSRFVNLKLIDKNDFIFFTNYNSPKAKAFDLSKQISALFFWSSINTQIRIKATIKKTSVQFNDKYFKERQADKNAIAISSRQSRAISSYDLVIKNFKEAKESQNLLKCPEYWGGYAFTPYEIEFWEGNDFRINKRDLYSKSDNTWQHCILEP